MRLQKFFILSTAGLFILAALAVFAMLSSIQLSKRASLQIADSVESIYALEELELALLFYDREQSKIKDATLWDLSKLSKVESDIVGWLKRVEKTSTETDRLRKIENQIAVYYAFRKNKTDKGPETIAEPDRLEIIYSSLEEFVEITLAKTKALQLQLANLAQFAFILSLVALVAMIIGSARLIAEVRSRIYLPLLNLRTSIMSFKVGNPISAPIPEKGLAELQEITAVFNQMSASVSHQQETQLKFLAGVAHDLRNPLAAIKMSVEFFLNSPQPEENKKILNIIKRQTTHLDRMVGDLLDTTRVEAGHLELKIASIDLRECVSEAALLFQNLSTQHKIKIDLPKDDVFCSGDPARLGQVLNNLISNAIKYSPDGGDVLLSLKTLLNCAEISVSDEGLGILKEDIDHIFEPFRRSSMRNEIPGVGLGLSVAKRIVEAHHGEIKVESSPNQGSVFRVRLPYTNDALLDFSKT